MTRNYKYISDWAHLTPLTMRTYFVMGVYVVSQSRPSRHQSFTSVWSHLLSYKPADGTSARFWFNWTIKEPNSRPLQGQLPASSPVTPLCLISSRKAKHGPLDHRGRYSGKSSFKMELFIWSHSKRVSFQKSINSCWIMSCGFHLEKWRERCLESWNLFLHCDLMNFYFTED